MALDGEVVKNLSRISAFAEPFAYTAVMVTITTVINKSASVHHPNLLLCSIFRLRLLIRRGREAAVKCSSDGCLRPGVGG